MWSFKVDVVNYRDEHSKRLQTQTREKRQGLADTESTACGEVRFSS